MIAGDIPCLYIILNIWYSKDVLTHTLDAISHPAVSTATFEASRYIDAGGMHVAVVSPDFTLINIWRDTEMN